MFIIYIYILLLYLFKSVTRNRGRLICSAFGVYEKRSCAAFFRGRRCPVFFKWSHLACEWRENRPHFHYLGIKKFWSGVFGYEALTFCFVTGMCPNALVETCAFSSRLPDANIEVVAGSSVLFSSLQLGDIRYYFSLSFLSFFLRGHFLRSGFDWVEDESLP